MRRALALLALAALVTIAVLAAWSQRSDRCAWRPLEVGVHLAPAAAEAGGAAPVQTPPVEAARVGGGAPSGLDLGSLGFTTPLLPGPGGDLYRRPCDPLGDDNPHCL